MKKFIITLWLLVLLLIVSGFFWFNQLKYVLPTPVPVTYQPVDPGKKITLPKDLSLLNSKPLLLHFFNPDCPCSRFNIDHFKSLVKKYHKDVNFAVVLQSAKGADIAQISKRFSLNAPIIQDTMIAKACGVYSTPQAVVLEKGGTLYYRGNYNKSRYCTDESTSYAKMAIEDVLHHQNTVKFRDLALKSELAVKAYGCTLPNCNN